MSKKKKRPFPRTDGRGSELRATTEKLHIVDMYPLTIKVLLVH